MGGGHGGWERRSKAFLKIKKKYFFFFFGGGGGSSQGGGGFRLGGGGQGGCERRSEVFVSLRGGGRVGGVRVDGSGEVKLL